MRTISEGAGAQVALGAWLMLVGAAFGKANPGWPLEGLLRAGSPGAASGLLLTNGCLRPGRRQALEMSLGTQPLPRPWGEVCTCQSGSKHPCG